MKLLMSKTITFVTIVCAVFFSGAGYSGGNLGTLDPLNPAEIIPLHWDDRMMPIEWVFSDTGYPGSAFDNTEVINEFTWAFEAWENLGASNADFVFGGEVDRRFARDDGYNLVTFTDSDIEFPPGVAAFAFTFSFTQETIIDDSNNDLDGDNVPDIPNGTYPAGTIYDGNIAFNSSMNYSTSGLDGSLDIRAIALHEVGHFLGLSHSSIENAVMWPFLIQDIDQARTLSRDDIATVSSLYALEPVFSAQFGAIEGRISHGANGLPVLGAHVFAVDVNSGEKLVGAYSGPDGSYRLPIEAGAYYVGIEPLDGDPAALDPERINTIIASTHDTNFIEELFDANEASIEADPFAAIPVNVVAGSTTADIHLQTNIGSVPGVTRVLLLGINYFAFPVQVPSGLSAHDLLQVLGDETEINAIDRLNPETQLFERVSYLNGVPVGKNFAIQRGEGYLVHAQQQKALTFYGAPDCPSISLVAGLNLIGVPCPPAAYNAFDLLTHLGSEHEVVALKRYDTDLGSFDVAEYVGGQPSGDNFFIVNGEAYVTELRVNKTDVSVPGQGTIYPPAITSISPGRGIANDLVLIQGEGFDEELLKNSVSFNGVNAHVIYSSTTTIATTVPANAVSGPLVVRAGGRVSNAVDFVIEPTVINEAASGATDLLPGQSVNGQIQVTTEQDRYTFMALEGALASISAETISGTADLMIFLEGPSGVVLVSDDDSGPGNSPAIRRFALPETGLYSIVVTTVSGTGDYLLSVDVLNTATQAQVSVIQGDTQSAVMGADFPKPLEVYITSTTGQPLVGVPVTFTATNVDVATPSQEGFSLQNAGTVVITTNRYGIAVIEATAPNLVGVFDIDVTVPGMDPVTMQVSTIRTAVAQMIISRRLADCGGQGCEVGQPVDAPYSIMYLDNRSQPVANVFTEWHVVAGGGSLDSFNPGASGTRHLTGDAGTAEVVHTLGERLYATVGGESTRIFLPQAVAAVVPGQLEPVLFTAVSKAGPPDSIESIHSNYLSLTLFSAFLNAMTVRVTDQYDNPVAGVSITQTSEELRVYPGLHNGRMLTSYLTDEDGEWTGLVETIDGIPPTSNEYNTTLDMPYKVVLAASTDLFLTFNVDVNLHPFLQLPAVFSGFIGQQSFKNTDGDELLGNLSPVTARVVRYERGDLSDDESWGADSVKTIFREDVRIRFSSVRADGVDPLAEGLQGTTIDGLDSVIVDITLAEERKPGWDSYWRTIAHVDVVLGEVGGAVFIVAELLYPLSTYIGGVAVSYPFESYRSNAIAIDIIPIEVRAIITGDQLGGLDWSTLEITLNGSVDIFDGGASEPPALGKFPHYIRVFIDGAEQLAWPSEEAIEAGGFSKLEIVYMPSASQLIKASEGVLGENILNISAETTEFDGSISSFEQSNTFIFNDDVNNRYWDVAESFNSSANPHFTIGRTVSLAQRQDQVASTAGVAIGSFHVFDVPMVEPGSVQVDILDANRKRVSTLIAATSLTAGDHRFVLLREDIDTSIVPLSGKPDLYVRVQTIPSSTGQPSIRLYSGELTDSVSGKMLGQVIQHDTLIQDGSLTLRREDLALSGAGPQLNFIRSYSNSRQPENTDTDLGPGWSHNHDIYIKVLARSDTGPDFGEKLPGWIAGTRAGSSPAIMTSNALAAQIQSSFPQVPSMVSVSNGGIFERTIGGDWIGQRGYHGTLTATLGAGYVYTSKDGTDYTFNTAADDQRYKVATVTDRNGNTLTYDYELKRLSRVTDQAGRYLNFTYGFADNGRSRLESVDAIVGSMNSSQNIQLLFNYFKHENGNSEELASHFDEIGMLQSFTRADFVERYDYEAEIGDNQPNLVFAEDANGHRTQYQYLALRDVPANFTLIAPGTRRTDIVSRVCYPAEDTSCSSNFASIDYVTEPDNAREVTDLNGELTRYELNPWGNPSRIVEPLGKITEFDWSIDLGETDNLMRVKRDLSINAEWEYEYDAKGNLTLETDPFDETTIQTWDQTFSVLTSRVDKNGNSFSQILDENGNVEQEISGAFVDGENTPTDVFVIHTYGSLAGIHGLRLSTVDGRTNPTTFDYDAFGNLTEIVEPGGSTTTYVNNARGVRTEEKDANENKTQYTYDDLDRVIIVTDAEQNTVEYEYDAKGNKLSETTIDKYTIGTKSHTRTERLEYVYDERDRVTNIDRSGSLDGKYAIGGKKTFTYDGNSNVLEESDWTGEVTGYVYDALNRRTSTDNRMGDSMSIAHAWVANTGLRITMTDYENHDTVEYFDKLGRLERVQYERVNHIDGTSNSYERVIAYDKHDNVTSILDEENKLTRYVYDPRYLKIEQINAANDSYFWEYDKNGNVTKTIDEEANETTFVYDDQNRLEQKDEPESHTWAYEYYPNDTLLSKTDPWGFEYTYAYDKINQLTRLTDPDGDTIVSHSKNGELVYRRDAEGRERSNLVGPGGRLQVSTDGRGRTTTHLYDHNNNITDTTLAWSGAATGPPQVQLHFQYDALDRLTHRHEGYREPIKRVTQYEYDRQSNTTREIDPEGRFTTYIYDERYRVKAIVTPATSTNLRTHTLQKFDGVGNRVWTRDRRRNVTTVQYDDLHRPETITEALEPPIVNEYDKVGNITKVTDKRGHSKESIYDGLYRVTEQFVGTFRLLLNEYDLGIGGSGLRQNAVTDANSNRAVYTLDFRGNATRITLPATADILNVYDYAGLLLSSTDASTFPTTYTYFDDGTLESVTNAESDRTTYTYDLFGNQAVITKPQLNTQTSTYDARNRLVSVQDDQGNRTRFEYDVNSNLRHQYLPAASDSGSTHVEYTYDTLNRKRSHTQHKSSTSLVSLYVYDAEGNVTQITDAGGQVFSNTYDALNRLVTETFPVSDDINSIVRSYDENNNPTRVTETKPGGVEVTDYTYDLLDRVTTRTQRGHRVAYTYDNNGNRLTVTAPGGSTTYTYDSRNRLQTARASGAAVATTYRYLQNGWLDVVNHANNTSVDYDYFDDGQTQTITNRSGEAVISSFAYLYDRNNNRTQQIETQTSFATAQVLTTDYVYDSLDRLESYSEAAGDESHTASHTFTYFPSYDRKTEIVLENAITIKDRSFEYDATYWLDSITETAGSGGAIQYTYDNNGNTLTKLDGTGGDGPASTVFAYNRRNQLKTLASGEQGAEVNRGTHHYNYSGMRIRHLNSDRGDIEYIYDGDSIIDEVQNGTTTEIAHYRYGDRLLSLDSGGQEQFYHYASLGTTANLSDSSGAIQVSYRVDPFGEITQQEGTSVNRQVFTGHEHDEETGLIYMKARFYDPDTGRFLSQDSYLGESGTPPSLHRYLYAYSNPNVWIDPTGHFGENFTFDPNKTVWDPKTQTMTQNGKRYKPSFFKALVRSRGVILFSVLNNVGGDSRDPNKRPPDWLFVPVEIQPQTKSTVQPNPVYDPNTQVGRERFANENPGLTDARAGASPAAPKKQEPELTAEANNGAINGGNRLNDGVVQKGGESVSDTEIDDDNSPEYTARDLRKTRTYRKNRKEILQREKVCQYCGEKPSTQADHIDPVAPAVKEAIENNVSLDELDAKINDLDNLAGSCGGKGGCNPSKGAKELSGEQGSGKYVPKNPSPRIQEKIDAKNN